MKKSRKIAFENKFLVNNILIIFLSLFLILPCLLLTFSYDKEPKNLKEATGIISEFKHYEKKWYDYISSNSKGPYFCVRLEDGSFFETTGISYSQIDMELFDNLSIGEEIKIIYEEEKPMSPDKIYAIEYNGKTYLSLDNVLDEFEDNAKTAHIVCPIAIIVIIAVAGILIFFNYKHNKKRKA